MKPSEVAICLLVFASPVRAQWTADGGHFLKGRTPSLLLVASDLEPDRTSLAQCLDAGFDAVWIRSLLNDTEAGIRATFAIANQTGIPVIGGLPIPNLKHLQVERIKQHSDNNSVLAWMLSTDDPEILRAAAAADPQRILLVPSTENLPAGTVSYSPSIEPRPESKSPWIVSIDISDRSESTLFRALAAIAAGADGIIFEVKYKGLALGESRLRWLSPKLDALRQFHHSIQDSAIRWETVEADVDDVKRWSGRSSFGNCEYIRTDSAFSATVAIKKDQTVYFKSKNVSVAKDTIEFSNAGEIWLGPKKWAEGLSRNEAKPGLPEAKAHSQVLLSLQARLEKRFEFCAQVFARMPRPAVEEHLPKLLPYFRSYYGESIAPLTNLKSEDGKAIDVGDFSLAGTVENFGEGKKEATDSLDTSQLTGQSKQPLKERIQPSLKTGGEDLVTLISSVTDLEDSFQVACLRWHGVKQEGGWQLQPINDSQLAGGVYIMNFSNDAAELCLSDGQDLLKHWTSCLATPSDRTEAGRTVKFGATTAVEFTTGYTVVIPPGASREIMVPEAGSGKFYWTALNRKHDWRGQTWKRVTAPADGAVNAGLGTRLFIKQEATVDPQIWSGELWRPLDVFELPSPEKQVTALETQLYRGEWQTVGITVHNPNEVPVAYAARPEISIPFTLMAYAYTTAQEWTRCHGDDIMLDLRHTPPDRPLPDGPTNGNLIYLNSMGEFWVPPHQSRQIFLIVKAGRRAVAGIHKGQLHISDLYRQKTVHTVPLSVEVWPITLPDRSSFRGTGYTIGSAIYRERNAKDAVDHYFNLMSSVALQPELSIDWNREEIIVGKIDPEKAAKEFGGIQMLARSGFKIMLGGWGATGMETKDGVFAFIDETVRRKRAAADGAEASAALEELANETAKVEVDEELEFEDEDDEPQAVDSAAQLRKKAESIKKKYWPGSPGFEKLTQQMYDISVRYYLAHGLTEDQLIAYVWDEAPASIFPTVVRMAKLMKQSHPKVPTYVTCLQNLSEIDTDGAIDIFSPHMGHIYDVRERVDSVGHALTSEARNTANLNRYQQSGKEVWCYMQHNKYLQEKHSVDYPMGLLWRAWQMDLRGFGIFSIRNCRGDLGYYPTKCYEAWREGVEDLLAMRALEDEIRKARKQGIADAKIASAEQVMREQSQEVLGNQWYWSDLKRRYRLIRAARLAIAKAHMELAGP